MRADLDSLPIVLEGRNHLFVQWVVRSPRQTRPPPLYQVTRGGPTVNSVRLRANLGHNPGSGFQPAVACRRRPSWLEAAPVRLSTTARRALSTNSPHHSSYAGNSSALDHVASFQAHKTRTYPRTPLGPKGLDWNIGFQVQCSSSNDRQRGIGIFLGVVLSQICRGALNTPASKNLVWVLHFSTRGATLQLPLLPFASARETDELNIWTHVALYSAINKRLVPTFRV